MLAATALFLTILLFIAFGITTYILVMKHDELSKQVIAQNSAINTQQETIDSDFNALSKQVVSQSLVGTSNVVVGSNKNTGMMTVDNNNLRFSVNSNWAFDAGINGITASNMFLTGTANLEIANINKLNVKGAVDLQGVNVKDAATLSNLNVSGASTFGDVSIKGFGTLSNLEVTGSANIPQLNVSGKLTGTSAMFSNTTSSNVLSGLVISNGIVSDVMYAPIMASDTLAVGSNGVPTSWMTSDGDIYAGRYMNVQQGVNVLAKDPGPMVQTNYSTNHMGERYGIGQFPNGTNRLYTADTVPTASVNLSYAKQDGNFDDVLRVTKDPSFRDYQTVISKGSLCMQDTCLSKTQFDALVAMANQSASNVTSSTSLVTPTASVPVTSYVPPPTTTTSTSLFSTPTLSNTSTYNVIL